MKLKKYFKYLGALKVFLNSTEETIHCGEFIIENIIPRLMYKKNFLDVGPGDGKLTNILAKIFSRTTVVDSSSEILSQLKEQKIACNGEIKLIHNSILNTILPPNYFDLCLISHVLYYIDRKNWLNVINKIYNATNLNGACIIVLSGENSGKSELISRFNGETIRIMDFIKECSIHITANIEFFSFKEKFSANNCITAGQIAKFLLNDAGIRARQNELLKYLNSAHRKSDGSYEISSDQNIIILYK